MPYVKKAELIEGVVHMPSPVRLQSHAQPHGQVITWLGVYCAATPGIFLADNATVRLDLDNEPQPDALLRLAPDQGGQACVSDDDYLEGPPELIAEIAASSAAYDLHEKLRVYRRSGVQEYLVWRVGDRQVDWFSLSEGEYVPLRPDTDGVLRSQAFPGLHLDAAALLDDDLAGVLAVLQRGLETAEHAAFVERLAAAAQDAGLKGT
jgi:Uma2 family endonuclease